MPDLFASLDMTPLPDGEHWRINKDFAVLGHVVPAGFVTDLASVPRPFWWAIPRWGKHGPAAILHDYLYRSGLVVRGRADSDFAEVMDLCEVKQVDAALMFWAVRFFGFHAWNKRHRRG